MAAAKRVMLVGWDAADWKMIRPLMDAGYMPALKGLVARGTSGNLATLSPVLSPMLWSSIATGKRPFKHGVHGFTEPTPDGTAVRPVTSMSRTTNAIWNILTLEGLRSHVVGWWPSHPAEPIKGCMVSNQYQRAPKDPRAPWPMPKGTVHPERLAEALEELRFHPAELEAEQIRLFVPLGHKIDQEKDRRLDSVMRIIADCTSIHAAATHLIEEEPWDFAAIYYDAIDHFGHGFMRYHPPKQDIVSDADFEIYNQVVRAGYIYHDMMLARLLELAGEDTTVILISDHGFHPDHLRPKAMPMEPAGPAIEHRDQGIFVAAGPGFKAGHVLTGASLLDIAPTVLTLFGLPAGEDMDGRPLADALSAPNIPAPIPSWDVVEGENGRLPAEETPDPDQSKAMMDQLIALGYIERPDADGTKAVADTQRELNYNLAMSYIDAGMHPKAAELLSELYRDNPLEFRFGMRLALCLQVMERPEAMAEVVAHLDANWRRASEEARTRLEAIATLGKERHAARKLTSDETAEAAGAAVDAEIEAVAEAPDDDDDTNAAQEPAGALFSAPERQVIQRLSAIARGNPQALDYMASSVAMARGDRDAALEHLVKAREAESHAPGFHVQLGNAFLSQARLEDAEQSFRHALTLDPESPNAHLGLCRVALKQNEIATAVEAARAAIALKYHFPVGHFYLGVALRRSGKLTDAIAAFDRALEQNPNFPEAHALLARSHRRLGDIVRETQHRMQLREIRGMRRAAKADEPPLSPLPLAEVDLDAHLPKWPEPPKHFVAPLLMRRPENAPIRQDTRPFVTIVSGLPRSGTSMAMQMLVAGGLPPYTDAERAADASNPRGYFEHDRVKRLQRENDWLDEARGMALKVVTPLLPFLPQDCDYRVILMRRDLDEVAASQARMLERLGQRGECGVQEGLAKAQARQTEFARAMLGAHSIPFMEVSYPDVLADPAEAAQRLATFLGIDLDRATMAGSVDPTLHRERPALPTAQ